jgi:hypothetical protein
MAKTRTFQFNVEADKQGQIRIYTVSKAGRAIYIDDVPIRATICSVSEIKRELALVFGAQFIRRLPREYE